MANKMLNGGGGNDNPFVHPHTSRRRSVSLVEAAIEILKEPDLFEKARKGEDVAFRWLHNEISVAFHDHDSDGDQLNLNVPDRPGRLDNIRLVPSHLMPKVGKGGSLHSRQAMVHSLVHTESWAIDLSWDIIARFGQRESMPKEFFTDFVKVALDEGRHFSLLAARLQELGSFYGDFPAHDGLWNSAMNTSHSLLARLAIEHCVHEARGLDVLPLTISRFRNGGDECTATLLENVVYPEEITHCAAGVKWFRYLCHRTAPPPPPQCVSSSSSLTTLKAKEEGQEEENVCSSSVRSLAGCFIHEYSIENDVVIPTFHTTVRKYFRGTLKPPFNKKARDDAGFAPEWYEPLAVKKVIAAVLSD